MDSSASESAHSPVDFGIDKEYVSMNDWDAQPPSYDNIGCINTPPASQSSPPASEHGNHHFVLETPNIQTCDDACENQQEDHVELPPCDEELTRWFGVMPPRVVDKMFDYLTSLNQFGQPDHNTASKARRTKQKPSDKVHLISSKNNNRWRSITPQIQDRLQYRMPPHNHQPSLFAQRNAEPLSPESQQDEMSPLSVTEQQKQQQQRNYNILQQLRSSYGMAKNTLNTLETTIQKIDSQMSKARDRHSASTRCAIDRRNYYNNSNPTRNNGKPSIPDIPENQNSYSKSMHTLQHLEKLFGCSSPPLSTPNQAGDETISQPIKPQMDTMDSLDTAEGVIEAAGGKEEDIQAAFDSLIDFGAGGNTYQSMEFGAA